MFETLLVAALVSAAAITLFLRIRRKLSDALRTDSICNSGCAGCATACPAQDMNRELEEITR